ncbi:MAG: hypothetical protein UV97_C0006G0048 [Candidatus Yanofskybacteria bacterium GW2011_GWF2_43_596]|nr:MAG: hypothetical protein UV97_C0006G0048 [Candidatus Yanofskybacteria bacterium GW2011_GWF2_43_596]
MQADRKPTIQHSWTDGRRAARESTDSRVDHQSEPGSGHPAGVDAQLGKSVHGGHCDRSSEKCRAYAREGPRPGQCRDADARGQNREPECEGSRGGNRPHGSVRRGRGRYVQPLRRQQFVRRRHQERPRLSSKHGGTGHSLATAANWLQDRALSAHTSHRDRGSQSSSGAGSFVFIRIQD